MTARKKLQIDEHLVVSAAPRMNFLAHVAQLAGEHQLHLRMNILHSVFNLKCSGFAKGVDAFEFGQEWRQFSLLQESDVGEHGDVGH